jgi:NAD(P)H-flavin reductase/hemoglobin-like flavoprotein
MDANALRASWARVRARGDEAPALFYAMLFTMAPHLRAMFPIAMTAQRDKLLAALGRIVSHVDDADGLLSYVEQLGRDHRRFAVAEQHYPIVGRALLATLHRVLGPAWTPGLAADWTAAYQLVADTMVEAAAKAATTSPPWWEATVIAVQRRCAQVTVLTAVPNLAYPFHPGQSVAVEYPRRPRLWRYFSPANAPRADGSLELHVRAVHAGQVSPALAYRCQVGDTLRLGAPVGTALCAYRTSRRDLLLIAGGTGLAPLRSIVEDLAAAGDRRAVCLVVGADTAAELYDLPALRGLHAALPSLRVGLAVARGHPGAAQPGSAVEVALRQRDWSAHDIYVCGSPGMVAGTTSALRAAGYADVVRDGADGWDHGWDHGWNHGSDHGWDHIWDNGDGRARSC